MNFKLSDEQRMFRDTVRSFARNEVAPLVEEAESTETFPRKLLRRAAEIGLLAVGLPEEQGGTGGDLMYMSLLVEGLAHECAGIALPVYACASMAWGLHQSGSEEQRETYLKPLLEGDAVAGLAITEPGAGSDVAAIRTSAVRDGDGWVLNGRKVFITNGPIADFVLVVANTDPERRPGGIGAFLVERGTPGFTSGKKLAKLGLRSSETSELVFEDCRIPASGRWGGAGAPRASWASCSRSTARASRSRRSRSGSPQRPSRPPSTTPGSGSSSAGRSGSSRRSSSSWSTWPRASRLPAC
jgi:alkylation response protein AidB-like acyl-CoA dehydrogenase